MMNEGNNLYQRAKAKLDRMLLGGSIRAKWQRDKLVLPLTSSHWELYDIIHRLFWRELHDFPNLINCRDFNDRIQWLKLFDQDAQIVRCSDKIAVRDHVRERVGDACLVELYQVHDHFAQIDFASLPNALVIKANHDSGTVILVPDKSKLDRDTAGLRIDGALKRRYGWENGEWAYSWIKPKVLVEELIICGDGLTPPPDFKWHCVEGKVRWLQYDFDRGQDPKRTIVFPDGSVSSLKFSYRKKSWLEFDVPEQWEEMKRIAEAVANGFKYVRVDTYLADGKIYVGELTFYPRMGCVRADGQRELGQLLDFDRTTFKPVQFGRKRLGK
jgi:hypothetical protein